jgi:hypothetical protein
MPNVIDPVNSFNNRSASDNPEDSLKYYYGLVKSDISTGTLSLVNYTNNRPIEFTTSKAVYRSYLLCLDKINDEFFTFKTLPFHKSWFEKIIAIP